MIRGKGTFNRTIEAIRKLTDLNIFVGANMFVHDGNVDLIKNTIQLADTLGVRAFNCINLLYVGRANSHQSRKN